MNPSPKFLVLMNAEPMNAAPRALLFDRDQHLMGEVIEDDGFIVDSLLLTAKSCPVPDDEMLISLVPPPSPQRPVRCYELS